MVTILGKSDSFSLFGANGATMVQNTRVHAHKGTRIRIVGYGCNWLDYVVYDDNMHAVQLCTGDPNDVNEHDLEGWFSDPYHTLPEEMKPLSQQFGIGCYYYDDDKEIISDEVIANSLKRAENIKRLEKEVKERKAKEAEETRELLLKKYSYLTLASTAQKYKEHIVAGNNIRTELKHNFPGVKFRVRYQSFSGGDSYDVDWEDGPTTDKVDAITKRYQDMHPDEYSMGDYWDCKPSIFNNLFGSVGYVMTRREITDKGRQMVLASFPGLTEDNYTSYQFEDERAIRARMDGCSLQGMLYRVAAHRDLMPEVKAAPTVETTEKQETKVGNLTIIDYSEKAIAVTGDTRPLAAQLRALGGRFNNRLSCGAGWVFPKSKRADIEALTK